MKLVISISLMVTGGAKKNKKTKKQQCEAVYTGLLWPNNLLRSLVFRFQLQLTMNNSQFPVISGHVACQGKSVSLFI